MELQLLPTQNVGGCNVITEYYSLIVANAETSILVVVISCMQMTMSNS